MPSRWQSSLTELESLVEALDRRDPEAARARRRPRPAGRSDPVEETPA
jgi:hypothetical protein